MYQIARGDREYAGEAYGKMKFNGKQRYAEVYNHHDDESRRSVRTTHWQPYEGYVRRFVESERLYFSILSIEHVKGYNEIGYGFKCRYFSTAFFASFLDRRYNSFECKFTIELFNRW